MSTAWYKVAWLWIVSFITSPFVKSTTNKFMIAVLENRGYKVTKITK